MAEETKLAHSDGNALEQESPPSYHATADQSAVDMPEGLPPYGANGYSEPPPSYDSLFGKVKAAKASSSNNAQFAKSFVGILMGTLACTIIMGIFLAIPIAMTAIGGVYLHQCPAERFIPIYLLVAGVFGIIKNLSSLGQKLRNKKEEGEDDDQKNVKTNPADMLLNCFLFAWFIAGNVWVYRTYGNFSTDETSQMYCHPTCYYFAFWIITSTYILGGLICFLTCCGGIVAAITTAK
ncbi:transmembrane protein 272-like [Ylistrum balloti]|uniref:transmembrane protein 272-like n=1 Tax=Ylistrum balloti TaxID=509963 RepID=UPI002905E9CC|nr:transmembrane protein 272-like [Ylistrum balloti]